MAKKKYNLTVIDQIPEVSNFVYRGIVEAQKAQIEDHFHGGKTTLKFSYDEGEAHLKTANIHTMVFSDYLSLEDEEELQAPREDE